MPSLVHTPMNLGASTLSIDAIEYSDAITAVRFKASSTKSSWIPISGNSKATTGPLTWTCEIEFGQDLVANTTLTAKLIALHGQSKAIVFKPTGTATQSITATCTITAPTEIGGAVGVATATASFDVSGQPTFVYGV